MKDTKKECFNVPMGGVNTENSEDKRAVMCLSSAYCSPLGTRVPIFLYGT